MAASYRGLVPLETTVLSLQNGLGNIETLQAALSNERLAGSTTEGAFSLGPGSVLHTGRGLTVIGDLRRTKSETCSRIKIALQDAGFQTKISSNMVGVLWAKAIVNAAINPLSALTRLPNGALAKSAEIRKIGFRVMDEGISVSRAERVRLAGDPRRFWRKHLL